METHLAQMKIGADPELFLVDAAGSLVASIGLIGGSKAHPRPLPIGDGFAVQEDNVALEYNIPASGSKQELINNINAAMQFLSDHVATLGLKFSEDSAALFPKDQLLHPMALEFGCDPDFNAWTGRENPKPKAPDPALRSCGGHVHIGHNITNPMKFVKVLDLFLAVPSVIMDKGQLRKQLYGKAGAFRPKEYGLEYRVLSNFWVFNASTVEWVWNNVELAAARTGLDIDAERDTILDAINNNNVAAAQHLITKYNIPLVM